MVEEAFIWTEIWKNPAYGRQSISRPMRIVEPIKKILLVRHNSQKNYLFLARRFYTLYEQKFSNVRHLLSNTFPQGFRKSKKLGHWTFRSGGKKRFKVSGQMKKSVKKNFFSPRQFYTIYEPMFSNLRRLLSITFPQGF